jgi:hypothetical protein
MLFYSNAKWLHLFLELVEVFTHITIEKDFTLFIHDTGIHFPGVEIDATDVFGINLSITHDKVCRYL